MRDGAVVAGLLRAQHRVREVVILVKHQIEVKPLELGILGHFRESARHRDFPVFLQESLPVLRPVSYDEGVKAFSDVRFKTLLERHPDSPVHAREVHVEDLKAVHVAGGVLRDGEFAEEPLEIVLLREVVVTAEHVDEKRLAKAARAHEEEERTSLLERGDVTGLVDIVVAFSADALEVEDAVGNLEIVLHAP